MSELTQDQVKRYSRHLIMPEVGVEGQQRLLDARVLLIGAGGLGSPLGLYLASAGVGTLGIVDFDVVDFSNLQRQIIHATEDVGRLKVESAKARIQAINPEVQVRPYNARLSSENIMEIIADYDIVVDGTDNFPTRYLVNDACVLTKKPNVYGSIFRFEGQASVFDATRGPCYRCLFPEPPPPGMIPSCAEGGVLGILPGLIGVIQATETIKLILGKPDTLVGRLVLVNALTMKFRELVLNKDPQCPLCGPKPSITKLIDYEVFCGLRRGEEAATGAEGEWSVDPGELKTWLEEKRPVVLLDVREPEEFQIVHLDGARLIPMSQLQERVHELDTSDQIVLYCHHGIRSLNALKFLDQLGFKKLRHLRGGIDAWAEEIDPHMARY